LGDGTAEWVSVQKEPFRAQSARVSIHWYVPGVTREWFYTDVIAEGLPEPIVSSEKPRPIFDTAKSELVLWQ